MSISSLARAVSTVVKETFSAPVSGSYVLRKDDEHLVIRQGGHYPAIDLSGYNLSGLDLHGTDLRGAKLVGANLANTNLSGANLSEADFSHANVSNAKFDGATIDGANLDGLRFATPPSGIHSTDDLPSLG